MMPESYADGNAHYRPLSRLLGQDCGTYLAGRASRMMSQVRAYDEMLVKYKKTCSCIDLYPRKVSVALDFGVKVSPQIRATRVCGEGI